jgi:hypothetical protein
MYQVLWAEHVEWPLALSCAIVAASFVVEQVGGIPNCLSKKTSQLHFIWADHI